MNHAKIKIINPKQLTGTPKLSNDPLFIQMFNNSTATFVFKQKFKNFCFPHSF